MEKEDDILLLAWELFDECDRYDEEHPINVRIDNDRIYVMITNGAVYECEIDPIKVLGLIQQICKAWMTTYDIDRVIGQISYVTNWKMHPFG